MYVLQNFARTFLCCLAAILRGERLFLFFVCLFFVASGLEQPDTKPNFSVCFVVVVVVVLFF